ncbi:MAG: hypothetical protein CMG96_06305 [Marinovum sp.]|nr:hypothetical protein [Marinovum sp.]
MSNVIPFSVPRANSQSGRIEAMIKCFATQRRFGDDVFWLKENAELLNILYSSGLTVDPADLAPYRDFYASIEKRMSFFPQYYRFLLSITQDLEALGLARGKAVPLTNWVDAQSLASAELSDLERAEAERLLQRGGIQVASGNGGLLERLHRFISHTKTFAVPNKKAAYELTHIIFYLSEYGHQDPNISADAFISLEFAGLLALLDQNVDLLSEICIAMRFAGAMPPKEWETWIGEELAEYQVSECANGAVQDHYHSYFMGNWLAALRGNPVFEGKLLARAMSFQASQKSVSPLRGLSESIFKMDAQRCAEWEKMRGRITVDLSTDAYSILELAEKSSPRFEEFFAGFARSNAVLMR